MDIFCEGAHIPVCCIDFRNIAGAIIAVTSAAALVVIQQFALRNITIDYPGHNIGGYLFSAFTCAGHWVCQRHLFVNKID